MLHLRAGGEEVVVKAGGPGNHHITREIAAHRSWTRPWLTTASIAPLLHADDGAHVLALGYLPGHLVEAHRAEDEPETYRQAGALLAALHGQDSRTSTTYEAQADAKTLRWLDGEHRIAPATAAVLRERIAAHDRGAVELVPTHGDYQPRNWLVDHGSVKVIDLGWAQWRPRCSDLARMDQRQWVGQPDLEDAFVAGYGDDLRTSPTWPATLLREAVGTAVWAHQVGEHAFEAHGHRLIERCLNHPRMSCSHNGLPGLDLRADLGIKPDRGPIRTRVGGRRS